MSISKEAEDSAKRLFEEKIYEQVVAKLVQGIRRDGLWAKALVDGGGIEDEAKPLYIKYRVQSIRDEIIVQQEIEAREAKDKQRIRERQERERIAKTRRDRLSEELTISDDFKRFLVYIGVVIFPYIFAWFTLREGYSTIGRLISFGWLALLLLSILTSSG